MNADPQLGSSEGETSVPCTDFGMQSCGSGSRILVPDPTKNESADKKIKNKNRTVV